MTYLINGGKYAWASHLRAKIVTRALLGRTSLHMLGTVLLDYPTNESPLIMLVLKLKAQFEAQTLVHLC